METFYLIIVIFIFLIAIFDLSVGVSNDAVNFLNSAIGAKAAPFKVIMAVAAIGIFVGASMSNGMMDIARHGIYQPQYFYMNEIMSILLAVMLTDVVLLDIFNTMGLPTSTTVSMIFALLGGTFALAIVKTINSAGALQMGDLITVQDNGRGIPVDYHEKEKKSALEVVMTVLHAGGKFDKGSYKVSGGLHGVGVSCVNALSTHMTTQVFRNGKIYQQEYSCGHPLYSVKEVGTTDITGTRQQFWPDGTIFTETVYNYDILPLACASWLI